MSKDSKHQDPRTWVKLPDGKPLMKAVPKRNLGKLLKDRGIKVTELATALGVKRQTVHGWINGTQTMSNAHLVHAGLLLDVSPLYLLDSLHANEEYEFTHYYPHAYGRSDSSQTYYVRDDLIEWLRSDWISDPEHYEPEHEKSAERLDSIISGLYDSYDEDSIDPYERYEELVRSLKAFPEDLRDPTKLVTAAFDIYLEICPSVAIGHTLTEVSRQVGMRFTRKRYANMKKR